MNKMRHYKILYSWAEINNAFNTQWSGGFHLVSAESKKKAKSIFKKIYTNKNIQIKI